MKHTFFYIIIFGLLFSACNPNKEIYEELDSLKKPYKADLEYSLKDADYTALSKLLKDSAESAAKYIGKMKAFGKNVPVSKYAGVFLDNKFIAPKNNSSCHLHYRYSVNEYDSINVYELTDDDYIAIGGQVAIDSAFSESASPETYLPDFLATKDTTQNYMLYVKAKYKQADMSKTDTALCFEYKNNAWEAAPAYILKAADYDSMGKPGQYDNFSNSISPDYYLPVFLSQKYPYASEGAKYNLVYAFYSGKAEIRMDTYMYVEGSWLKFLEKSDQFVHNGSKWLFDPTIKYNMQKEDYQVIVNYIAADPQLNVYMDPQYDNSEFYYGASSHYGNFDMRLTKRKENDPLGFLNGLSDDEVNTELENRLPEALNIFLEDKFPDAEPVANGVDVYYEVIYSTYNYVRFNYSARFKCVAIGKFEYVETHEIK